MENDYQSLLKKDEFNLIVRKGTWLDQFSEPQIEFGPTSKYKPGTAFFDPDQIPAWTDRILVGLADGTNARIASYGRSDMNFSEHRPVHSWMEIDVKIVDKVKEADLVTKFSTQFCETA